MKHSLKLLLLVAGALGISMTNTACTPTEAALVGAVTGAAIGYAVADDDYYHGGHHGGHGYQGGHGYHGGGYYNQGGYCY